MKIKLTIAVGLILILFGGLYFFNQNKVTAHIPAASSFATTLKDWNIVFSEQMDPDTFKNDSVTVTNQKNEMIPVSFQWNKEYTTLTLIAPEGGYKLDEMYDISISKNVQSTSGKPLKKPLTHTFTAYNELPAIKDQDQLTQLLKERRKLMEYEVMEEESATADMSMSGNESSNDSGTASTTNVQVKGIDEGDILKSDGNFIYFSRDTDIIIAKADQIHSRVVSRIQEKDFYPTELYIHNNILISVGHSFQSLRKEEDLETNDNQYEVDILPFFNSQTSVFLYDISDRSNPKQIREVSIEGNITASRKMDGYLYLVLNNYPPFHILEESNIDARPFFKDTAMAEESEPIQYDNLFFFPDSNDEYFLVLASIDLNQPEKEAFIESYLGASNQLYMSKNNMYITVQHYSHSPADQQTSDRLMSQSADTEIFQFTVKDGKITYKNSTVVNGTLINQFAMDETDETFRVATTKGDMWNEINPSTNNIYTYDLDLKPLGSVEGLAKGERIYSVRFMNDVAYMVTFKQVDPLFVVDLKDPTNPTVLGELKIPGFSNYLHPLDEQHVIGFGQHTEVMQMDTNNEPIVRVNGLKISVFDVTDPADPKEKYSEIIGQGSSHSELNYNHKTLYQHPSENIFGFPAVIYETKLVTRGDATYQEDSFVYEGAFLYEITPDRGIQLKDTITHQEKIANEPFFDWWPSHILRMISVDDSLYTLSYDKMKVYDLMEEIELQTVELPEMENAH